MGRSGFNRARITSKKISQIFLVSGSFFRREGEDRNEGQIWNLSTSKTQRYHLHPVGLIPWLWMTINDYLQVFRIVFFLDQTLLNENVHRDHDVLWYKYCQRCWSAAIQKRMRIRLLCWRQLRISNLVMVFPAMWKFCRWQKILWLLWMRIYSKFSSEDRPMLI